MFNKIRSLGAILLVLTGMLLGIISALAIPLIWADNKSQNNTILERLKELEDWKAQIQKEGRMRINAEGREKDSQIELYQSGTRKWEITSDDSNYHSLEVRSSDGASGKFVLTQAGNVGIGITMPEAKLDVKGTIITSGDIVLKHPNNMAWILECRSDGLWAKKHENGILVGQWKLAPK